MSAHTPGPWFIGPSPFTRADSFCIWTEDGYYIGEASNVSGQPENSRNADLIAAAPDLLNALRTLADAAESRGIPCDAARAAIEKATGSQP